MGDLQNTSAEGTQTGTEGKTFTQDDVNRIVQERLAKERGKGKTTEKPSIRAQLKVDKERAGKKKPKKQKSQDLERS